MKMNFKQMIFFLFFDSLFAWAQSDIIVEAFDEQWNNPSQITLRLRLTNLSQDTLTNVRLRYFLGHDENRTLELSLYYLTNANVYLDTIDNYLAVNIDIPQVVPGTFPNSSGISLGLRYQDNNIFHKNGNFSYPGTVSFEPTSNIPVYVDNMYMAGNTPVGDEIPKVHFYGIQPEAFGDCPAWVELKNDGPLDVSLKDFYLKSSSSDSLALLDAKLLAGQKIRICNTNDIQKCPQEDLVQISDSVDFNNYENFSILWKGTILENIPYVPYEIDEVSAGGVYIEKNGGVFFTMKNGMWVAHHFYDLGHEDEPPSPQPYSRNTVSYGNDHVYRFAWHSVEGVQQYLLTVVNDNDSIVHQQLTNRTHVDLQLEDDHYLWGVQNADGGVPSDGSALRSVVNSISKIDADIDSTHMLHVPVFRPRKDTRMLVLNWGNKILEKGWDRPNDSDTLTAEEEYRCWVVAIQMINAYYGGNLTQDEIKFHGKTLIVDQIPFGTTMQVIYPARDSIFSPFLIRNFGGGYRFETLSTLAWALNIESNQIDIALSESDSVSVLTKSLLKKYIDAEQPLLVANSNHAMVVDGYDFHEPNHIKAHFLNIFNDGKEEWRNIEDSIYEFYLAPPKIDSPPRFSDYRIDADSDGDSLIDFDEELRFKTNPNIIDSDHDGIDDKTEIASYALRTNYKSSELNFYISKRGLTEVRIWSYSDSSRMKKIDVDCDGKWTWLDKDSDHAADNGTWDGFEDLNHNGILDDGETDPYNSLDDTTSTVDMRPLTEWGIPDSLTIYSIGGLYMNDRSKCYDGEDYCKIAAESGKLHYAVSVGVDSKIGSIISKGGVGLRNRASVFGNIDIYSLPNNYAPIEMQESANLYGNTFYHNYMDWPYRVIDGEEHHIDSVLGTSDLIIHRGQQATLNDGDHYRSVRVMYGGKLKVNPGQMYVGNIQLESGSQLEFLESGKETVIHAEGAFLWRASLVNEDKNLVARGFKLIQYGEQPVFVEGDWAGTIHAAKAQLILGQTVKNVYGRFLGNGVTVHQNTDVYRVDFNPIQQSIEISFK